MAGVGLRRRLDRLALAGAARERRLVVLEVDADRRADEAPIDRTLAEAGVVLRPADLVVKLLRPGAPPDHPPCAVLRVSALDGAAGGAR